MGLLNNKQVVAGLFDNDADVDEAVNALQKLGYGSESDDAITIVDQHQFAQETPADEELRVQPVPANKSFVAGGVPPTPDQQTDEKRGPTFSLINEVKEKLDKVGIDDEEADFFTQRVVRGAKLVAVKVETDDVAKVEKIFTKAGQIYSENA